jgi:hypothetical protein
MMGDPDAQPVGLQRDGDALVLLVPLCPKERVESVFFETVPDTGESESVGRFPVADDRSGEIRVGLDELPDPLPENLVVSVLTSQVERVSSLDPTALPMPGDGLVLVEGKIVPRKTFMAQPEDCPT